MIGIRDRRVTNARHRDRKLNLAESDDRNPTIGIFLVIRTGKKHCAHLRALEDRFVTAGQAGDTAEGVRRPCLWA